MTVANSTRSADLGVAAWINNFLASAKRARQQRAIYSNTLRALDAMSDRDLMDINISRHNIRDIAREAASGK